MRRDTNNENYDNINEEGYNLMRNGSINGEHSESNKIFDFSGFKEFIDIKSHHMEDDSDLFDSYLNVIKKNSFMLLKDTYENIGFIPDEVKSNIINLFRKGSSDSNNKIHEPKHSVINPVNDYICEICKKYFPSVAAYEMHVKYCINDDDPNKWDNFGNNYYNSGDSNDNSNDSKENIANDDNYVNNNYLDDEYINQVIGNNANEINVNLNDHQYEDDNSNYYENQSYSSQSLTESFHEDHHAENIDYNDPNLNYEELIRLDDNIKHPLNKFYLSMLVTEKLQKTSISFLSGDSKKCLICFDDFEVNQKIIRLPCLHIFHETEITQWFESNKTCPICRVNIEELLSEY